MNREGAEEGGNSLPVSKLKEVRAAEKAAENATGSAEQIGERSFGCG